jgi:hypothetical protein
MPIKIIEIEDECIEGNAVGRKRYHGEVPGGGGGLTGKVVGFSTDSLLNFFSLNCQVTGGRRGKKSITGMLRRLFVDL